MNQAKIAYSTDIFYLCSRHVSLRHVCSVHHKVASGNIVSNSAGFTHAEDIGQLSTHVPLLNVMESQHQAPLADVAEWLSQNLQNDMQGEAMASSPTHVSRWGPLAPAGIVESECSSNFYC